MPLPEYQKSLTICPLVLTQYQHWTDRRTELVTHIAYFIHCMLMRDNNGQGQTVVKVVL